MSKGSQNNVQDVFLNIIRRDKVPVTIFLVNGVKLQGTVIAFDNFAVMLKNHVVQTGAIICIPNIHPRSLANGVQPLQYLDTG